MPSRFQPNSFKTNSRCTNEVTHFSHHPNRVVTLSKHRKPKVDDSPHSPILVRNVAEQCQLADTIEERVLLPRVERGAIMSPNWTRIALPACANWGHHGIARRMDRKAVGGDERRNAQFFADALRAQGHDHRRNALRGDSRKDHARAGPR